MQRSLLAAAFLHAPSNFLKPAAFLGTLGSGALIGLFGGVTVLAHKIIGLLTYMEHVPAEDD